MNKIYKVIWSEVRNCYVAVSEIAKRNGKSCASVHCGAKAEQTHTEMALLHCGAKAERARAGMALSAIVGALLLAGVCSVLLPVRVVLAAPVMPTLDYRGASPDVTIATTSSNTTAAMDIKSTQANNVLKWIDFSIGQGGTVQFDGQNYLNYVTGHGRSEIDGVLKGGGSIYLINPNGILFGSTARVDVGSLHLSTRRLTDGQLQNYESARAELFRSDSAAVGDVINLGKLNADLIEVEGKNITFKNVADVTKGGTLKDDDITGGTAHYEAADGSVTLTVNNETGNEGEIHLGFAVGVDGTLNGSAAEGVSAGQYTNVTVPDFNQTSNHSFNHWMTNITPTHYMLVRNGYELQNMQNNLTETNGTKMPGNYMLANDIDLQDGGSSPTNFQPIGYRNNSLQEFKFEGKFDGLNYAIKNLRIDTSSLSSDKNVDSGVGLFGINAGTVENVGVKDTDIAVDKPSVGGIVGINSGTIRNVYHTGAVTGNGDVGGIAGHNESGASIALAYNTGNITAAGGYSNVGGIAGINEGTIAQVYNTGKVGNNSNNNVGGIAGKLAGAPPKSEETYKAKIEDAYNYNTNSTSTDSLITGSSNVGGIVGLVEGNDSDKYLVRNTYNTGIVSAENNNNGGIIGNVSSAGSGNPTVDVVSSYFSEGTPNTYSGGTENQKTIAELQRTDTFDNWSLSAAGGAGTTWRIYEGETMPLLTAFLKTKDLVKVYEYDGSSHSVPMNDTLLDDSNIKKSDQFAANWDNYTNSLTDAGVVNILKEDKVFLYSLQDGYDIADMKLIVQPKALTATFADISKTYDGTNAATLTLDTLSGVVDADKAKLAVSTTSATYSDKNAGENKTVTYAGLKLSGDKAENYSIATTATGKGTISPKQLTVTFADIKKTYDGTTDDVDEMGYVVASRTGTLEGVVAVDDGKVSVSGTATYADKNVSNSYSGPDKTVYYSGLALGAGTDGDETANYVLASTTMTVENNGRIDKANVTLTAADVTKTYDGTTDVTGGTLVEYSGAIFDSDSLSGGTFAFEDKNAGTNKTVTVSSGSARITDVTTGADTSGNYNITYENNTTSTIKAKEITANFDGITKEYDGDVAATAGGKSLAGVIGNDDVSFAEGITGAFADKNVGTDKTVTYSGIALTGTDAGNYSITATANGKGNITAKAITANFDGITKEYDGGVAATAGGKSLAGVIGNDDVSFAEGITGAFADKNVGTDKTVTYSGIALTGTDAGNYSIAATADGKGDITVKAITASFDGITKEYDGGVAATAGGKSLTGVIGEDDVGFAEGITGAFADKNVGTDKTVTYSGIALTGTDAGNYSIAATADGKGDITAKAITANFDSITKEYDGGVAATADGKSLAGVINNDDVSFAEGITGAFADKNVGTDKTVTYSGIALTGTDAGNYSITATANGKGNITAKAITANFDGITKEYDGSVAVTADGKSLAGVIGNDNVDFAEGITGAFADKNVGTEKTVTYSGIALTGTDAGNYSIAATADGKGNITAKAITANFDSITKEYDGGVAATADGKSLAGVINNDDVSFAEGITGAFADKNVGTDKTVTYSGIALTGTDAGNYSIAATADGKGDITAKAITASFDGITKEYDGGVAATAGGKSLTGVIGEDDVGFAEGITGAFADKNVGTDKTVTYSGIALTGTDAGNYSIAATADGKGDITAKAITANFDSINKTYDGTTNATAGAGTLNTGDIISGDDVSLNEAGITAAYGDKDAGEGKTVNYTGIALSGTDANNYSIATTATGAGTIEKKTITVTFADTNKTYDGTTNATAGVGTLKGVKAVDDGKVSVSANAAYDRKDAGSRKVSYTNVALSGEEANNYSIATTAMGAGTIDKKAITATFADISKTYDGTTDATAGAGALNAGDIVNGDDVSLNESGITAVYADKNAGDGKTVNYSGLAISGADTNNYSIASAATGKGTIYRKALELVADEVTVQEGGAMPATFTGSITGFVEGETIGSGDTLLFALSNPSATAAGSYGITGTLNGSASGNYGLNYTFSNAASNANAFVITAKPASVEDVTVSDLIPAAEGTVAEDIKITEVDDALEQASDKEVVAAVGFAVSQGVLPVDIDRGSSFEVEGMELTTSMTTEDVAEQESGDRSAAQKNGNASVTGNKELTNATDNGAVSNAGGDALNAVVDIAQKTDETIDTEERKREKEAAENE